MVKPNFLIVGAAKAGTTSLYYYLNQHPEIQMSKVKEPFFFAYMNDPNVTFRSGDNPEIITSSSEYEKLYDLSANHKVLGESSTWYLYLYEKTIKNIKEYYENVEPKIIVFLRNPIERCWSHYQMNVDNGWEDSTKTFEEVIEPKIIKQRLSNSWAPTYDYIGYGMYYEQVNAYIKNFSNVKIFLFDEFIKNRENVFLEIFNFLGIDNEFKPNTKVKYNFSGNPKNKFLNYILFEDNNVKKFLRPLIDKMNSVKFIDDMVLRIRSGNKEKIEMNSETKHKLNIIYKDKILKLQELLNIDLNHWLD